MVLIVTKVGRVHEGVDGRKGRVSGRERKRGKIKEINHFTGLYTDLIQ